MANRLPIPPELSHLIEKRDDVDRRTTKRRATAKKIEGVSPTSVERRKRKDRRTAKRRSADK